MTINPQKTRIVHVRHGFEFLGYKIKRGSRPMNLPTSKVKTRGPAGMALCLSPREVESVRGRIGSMLDDLDPWLLPSLAVRLWRLIRKAGMGKRPAAPAEALPHRNRPPIASGVAVPALSSARITRRRTYWPCASSAASVKARDQQNPTVAGWLRSTPCNGPHCVGSPRICYWTSLLPVHWKSAITQVVQFSHSSPS